jgi:hypothetical protein
LRVLVDLVVGLPTAPDARDDARMDRSSWHVARSLAWQLAFVAGVGLIAIGVSGLLALSMRAAFGTAFVAGDPEGVTYTASRCADFLEYYPDAGGCEAAASDHHADEVVGYRMAAGVMGALMLAARLALGRRRPAWWSAPIPRSAIAAAGASLFGLAAVVLGGQGLAVLVIEGTRHGPGQWISAGMVSLVVFAAFSASLWRALTEPAVT